MSDQKADLNTRLENLAHTYGVLLFKADRVKAEMIKLNAIIVQLDAQEAADKAKQEAETEQAKVE